jgi:hypothetical protein
VTLRVPDGAVAGTLAALGRYGTVTSTSLHGRDVTGQVVDLAAEITNLTSEEQAVRALLAKAGSVRNILSIQQSLFSLQGQIQELTAQHNSLDSQVQYATVVVALATAAPPGRVPSRPSTVARFWHLASGHTVAAVRGVFLGIGWAAPLLLLAAVLGGGWWGFRRRQTHRALSGTDD